MRAVDRLHAATRHLHVEMENEAATFLDATTVDDYRRFLTRTYGFVSPLERCLLDTPGVQPYLDHRRLRKHLLIEHDLQTLGMKAIEIQSIPQCMWIPWFDDECAALGWAYIVERGSLGYPNLFRHLATVLPGEAAFSATFLKVYNGATTDMWTRFGEGIEVASSDAQRFDRIVSGALAGYKFFRRWRNTLDGKHITSPPLDSNERSTPTADVVALDTSSAPEES